MLVTWLLFRSRARVVLGSELRLLMSFSWPVFPGLDQVLLPPWFSSFFGIRFQSGAKVPKRCKGFWDSIPKRCKGVHCVDLGESFPTSIYLQNLASIQPRTSLVKFARSPRTDPPGRWSLAPPQPPARACRSVRQPSPHGRLSPR